MKRLTLLGLCAALLCTFCACPGKDYREDLTSAEIAAQAERALPSDSNYLIADAHFLDDYFSVPDFAQDYTVRFCADRNNLDEFGIFRVVPGHAPEMHALLSGYLSDSLAQNRAWYDSYIPQETPKLRDAEIHTFGNTVVYAILSPENRAIFFQAIQNSLKK